MKKLLFILTLAALTSQAQTKVILFTDIDPMATMLVAPDTNYLVPANVIPLPDGLGPWYLRMSKEPFTIGEEYPAQLITKDTAFSFYGILPFVLETKNNDEYEVVITKKEVAPPEPVIKEIIDAASTRITYSGSPTTGRSTTHWVVSENQQQQPWYNKNLAYTFTLNATASLTVTGKRVQIFAERKSSHGDMEIKLGDFVTVKSLGTSNNGMDFPLGAPIFDMVVPQGTYPLTIKAINAGAGKFPIVLDVIRIWE
jgi:hypothetical protein